MPGHDQFNVGLITSAANITIQLSTMTSGMSNNTTVWAHWINPATCANVTTGGTSISQWINWNTYANEVQAYNGAVLAQQGFSQSNAASYRLWRRQKAMKRLAKYRAEKLLLSVLCEEQRRDLKQFGFFKLYVQRDGKTRVYRIRRGQIQNIELMEELPNGDLKPVKTLCAHPSIMVPDADAMLAQKLMLETDEERFLQIANHMAVMNRSIIPAPTSQIQIFTEPVRPVVAMLHQLPQPTLLALAVERAQEERRRILSLAA